MLIFVKGGEVKPRKAAFSSRGVFQPSVQLDSKVPFWSIETSNIDEAVCASFKRNCLSINVVNGQLAATLRDLGKSIAEGFRLHAGVNPQRRFTLFIS